MKKTNIILASLSTFILTSCQNIPSNNDSVISDNSSFITNGNSSSYLQSSDIEESIESSVELPSPSTTPDVDYNASNASQIQLLDNASSVVNNNGYVVIDGNTIYITKGGTYELSGTLSEGKVIVNPESEEENIELDLLGVSITCSKGAPIGIFNGNGVDVSAKSGTVNTLIDMRSSDEENQDGSTAALYSAIDMKVKGSGTLNVTTSYNNGIGSKDDLTIKNATIHVTAINNAIKGNDSLTIESGNIEAISTLGDALKTENSDISSKGNQRGNITITGGTLNLYAACDAIDAAYDVTISGETTQLQAYTDSYSSYSGEVSATSEETMYIGFSQSSRPGQSSTTLTSLRYAAYFTLQDNSTVWADATKLITSGGFSQTTYYSLTKPSNASKVTFYAFNSAYTTNSTTSFSYVSENLSIPSTYDTFKISSASGSSLNGNWSNYTTQNGPGGFGGGMNDGNSNKADYSCKGIKADNSIQIDGGSINIKSHDDAIHANNDTLLETSEYGKGDVTISNGTLSLYSDDDGIHADNSLTISGGDIAITNSYEGIEGLTVNLAGGTLSILAEDDGINAGGGSENANNEKINITGGVSYIQANGDVIDSNGSIEMSGGVVFAQGPSSSGNGLLDFDTSFSFKGGFLFGFGTSSMAQKPTASSGNTVLTQTFSVSSGNYINVTINNEVLATLKVSMSNLSYLVLAYNNATYGSNAVVSTSSSSSMPLINNAYYFAK